MEKYGRPIHHHLQKKLFFHNDPKYGITSSFISKRHGLLTDYISDVIYACAGIWYCDSNKALEHRTFSFKRYICEGINQIPNEVNGAIHICFESYEGKNVEEINYIKTKNDLINIDLYNKNINYIYLHNIRFLIPYDKNWELEEDVYPFCKNDSTGIQFIENAHILGLI